jgi:hypothetical protein
LESFGKECVRHPQVEVGVLGHDCFDRESADIGQCHRGVAVEASVLGSDFPCAVGKPPRRVSEDSLESAVGLWQCWWRGVGAEGGRCGQGGFLLRTDLQKEA